ncbi:universal stress global response regulator UspA [Vibrio fortis]|jgi:nucleotide-binding universal stress UspA family protein|uniref:Universal stress protein n=2 Tax=Vibrio fortis TaxID=212667 RepID=A0A066V0E4_9VIBR|nr:MULTISPECIES: universal stress protein [Vibrio]KAB0303650.1 universal stress global response regulator UspA [Vibrio fortis]KDN29969.1 universal stress global response regulator UspA [Vibrio fortis]MDK9735912.1 universal stress protein [Vibrio sp. D404a]MDK9796776.1 universal stress protein [Vibrio sp. D449a]QFT09877.1 Universal stress protein A [Vibrio sp. THAF190c]|tara:strand:+ start:314 stop:736 length:423 start_codon:yes stop_codon:yes gene_type:complete
MEYKHILVAIELSQDTNILIDRATFFANKLDADLSFVYIDGTHGEIYPELVDIKQHTGELPFNEDAVKQLRDFEAYSEHNIKHLFMGTGDLTDKLKETVAANQVDFLICGHHHDFWSKIISHSKQLIDKSPVDILVVPIE